LRFRHHGHSSERQMSLALLQTKHNEWLTYAWKDICLSEE